IESYNSIIHYMGLFILLFLCILCCSQAIALQEVDCNDNEVFNAVDIALKEYNRGRKNGHLFALNVILEASPGKNFLVKYQIRESTCAVGEDIPWEKCSFIAASEGVSIRLPASSSRCKGHAREQWENKQCSPGKVASSQAPCLGCWTRISTKASELQPVVKHGIELFNNESDENALFGVKKILTAESQVVAGWNYKVQYSIKTTNCSKAELPLLTPECQAIPEGIKADSVSRRKSDEIVPAPVCVGCPVSISIHNPELQEPLAAALEKYNSESQNDFHYAIVQITKATSQVGTFLLHLYFNFVQTQCSVGVILAHFPLLEVQGLFRERKVTPAFKKWLRCLGEQIHAPTKVGILPILS
uniref:Cystatin domain-containing protein n=1 Tax=Varanus komodoensis TaxID=61221 RepID=A0A8D2L8H7_VARKO